MSLKSLFASLFRPAKTKKQGKVRPVVGYGAWAFD